MARVFNFSAGPSMLPLRVLEQAASEMTDYKGSGMSVMEMSHRSKIYDDIFNTSIAKFRTIMQIPDHYKILFLQGGATLQFAMVPMNLISRTHQADYAVTGKFSASAYQEARKYGAINLAADSGDRNHTYIPRQSALKLNPNAAYFHYCDNNTIFGTEWDYIPDTGRVPLVCDMSSNILSKPVDVSKFGLIYAGAQKNMAPAGLTVVIIREDLAGAEFEYTPLMLSYANMIKTNSMYNTPPTYNIYILGLVLDWLEESGGLPAMQQRNEEKAKILYDYLDTSKLFIPHAESAFRSRMNVTFKMENKNLEASFLEQAGAAGFKNLKGHRDVGGIRASIYNAMPREGVLSLTRFMEQFEKTHI